MNEEVYGINKDFAHKKAIEILPEEFFWDCIDELAPFGSDEGDMALSEYRDWRKENPNTPTYNCLVWTIESVGEIAIEEYNEEILDKKLIKSQIDDVEFDDHQSIYTLDTSVIATGFGQLVDEGRIDAINKPFIILAIQRQKYWAELLNNWEYKDEYIERMNILERALNKA